MALAKKCDRCGVLYKPYNEDKDPNETNGFLFLNLDCKQLYYRHNAFDLCPACNDELHEWLEHPERGGDA